MAYSRCLIMENKPRIRFKGFTEDWKQRKLGDAADVRDGTHDSPKFYNDGFPLVTSKNLKDGSIDFSECSFISEQDFEEINKRSKVDLGDILFGMIGTIGNPAIVEHTGFAIKNVALIKQGNIINNRFIYHLLSSKVFENYIARENAGGTQKFIALNQIRNFDFLAPALVEQNKIIELLDCISQNITLHQRKLEKLKLAKKALLQKLFPKNGSQFPEIRFKGFTDAWEQRKLDEVCNVYDGTHQTPRYTNSGVMFVSVEDIETLESNKYITEEDFKSEFKVFPEYGDILLTRIGDVGSANVILDEIKRAYYVSLALLKPKNINSLFLLALLGSSSVQSEIWRRTLHIAFPKKINKNEINKVIVKQPSIPEQEKISKLFFSLDQTITLHQRKLDKLQEVKKGLLQKMFV